jgi:hypothetical protein
MEWKASIASLPNAAILDRSMRLLPRLIVQLALAYPSGVAMADDPAACFNARCQDKAQSCLTAAADVENACQKSARAACDKVLMSQKFACLSKALNLCGPAHSKAEAACLEEVHSCGAACGPSEGKTANYWCTARVDDVWKSGFCAAPRDQRVREQWDQCYKQLFLEGAAVIEIPACYAL